MINVRKEIVSQPFANGGGFAFTLLVGDRTAIYMAKGVIRRKGKEDAIKGLRDFLKGEGVECE